MRALRKSNTERWLKTLPKRVASSAMILENSVGQALIVKAGYKPYWTFPGGIIDPDETPKDAAMRETFEEVGITLDPETVTFVAVVNRKSDVAETYQFIFKAPLTPEAMERIELQASEIEEYALVTKVQATTSDRLYGNVIDHWVSGRTGYIEQTLTK